MKNMTRHLAQAAMRLCRRTLIAQFVLLIWTLPAAAANWLPGGWTARHPIEVTTTSAFPLVYYQVKIVLPFSTGLPTYADVRFTDSDGVTLLRHWLEESGAGSATFWVKVPYLAADTPRTIWVYYGNASAKTASDAAGTFDFFDDFGSSDAVVKSDALFEGIEPSVLKEGAEYWLYYDLNAGIYRRTSTDGLTWSEPTLITGASGQYVHVYKDFDRVTYRLLYADLVLGAIRLATSSDGVNFIDQGVLFQTQPGEWYSDGVFDPCEVLVGGTYYLYVGGRDEDGVARIGLVTSTTGRPGTYTEVAQSPVIQPSGSGLDASSVFDADVLAQAPGQYIMFYTGYNESTSRQVTTYATSSNLKNWTASGAELYGVTETWEQIATFGPNEPSVLIENNQYVIWYRGTANSGSLPNYIGRATVPRNSDSLAPEPASRWATKNASLSVTAGRGVITTTANNVASYVYSKVFRAQDGSIEAKMKRTSPTYFNVNLSGRINATSVRDHSVGPAGTLDFVYLFSHRPAFFSFGNAPFITGLDDNVYHLGMRSTSLLGQMRRATDPTFTGVSGVTSDPPVSGPVGFYLSSNATGTSSASVDWVRVRQFDAPVSFTIGTVETMSLVARPAAQETQTTPVKRRGKHPWER